MIGKVLVKADYGEIERWSLVCGEAHEQKHCRTAGSTHWSQGESIDPIIASIVLLAQACRRCEEDHGWKGEEGGNRPQAELEAPSGILFVQTTVRVCTEDHCEW